MPNATEPALSEWTVADLLDHFGPIALRRIRQDPAPGTAVEQDVVDINDRENRLYELVEGVLVEKTMGVQESFLAVLLARVLGDFVDRLDLGFVLGSDGMARLASGLVRIPDVSFISWRRFPDRRILRLSMLGFAPDLAVEVLSPWNTTREMNRKLQDYFETGVGRVWYVDPVRRTIQVFTAVEDSVLLHEDDTLHGEPMLPGFALLLSTLFAKLES